MPGPQVQVSKKLFETRTCVHPVYTFGRNPSNKLRALCYFSANILNARRVVHVLFGWQRVLTVQSSFVPRTCDNCFWAVASFYDAHPLQLQLIHTCVHGARLLSVDVTERLVPFASFKFANARSFARALRSTTKVCTRGLPNTRRA